MNKAPTSYSQLVTYSVPLPFCIIRLILLIGERSAIEPRGPFAVFWSVDSGILIYRQKNIIFEYVVVEDAILKVCTRLIAK